MLCIFQQSFVIAPSGPLDFTADPVPILEGENNGSNKRQQNEQSEKRTAGETKAIYINNFLVLIRDMKNTPLLPFKRSAHAVLPQYDGYGCMG